MTTVTATSGPTKGSPEVQQEAPSGAARHKNFLVGWCIALAVVAILVGALLPLFVESPPYPDLPFGPERSAKP